MENKSTEMNAKRILHLTLHRRWFDLIASGLKVIEYRQDNDYWHKRIFNADGSHKNFDEIHSRNGYGHHRPLMVTEFLFAFVTHSSLCSCEHGEDLEGRVIVIAIGDKLRFENYSPRLCGGCGTLVPCTDSLCEECRDELLSGKTAWVNETRKEKSSYRKVQQIIGKLKNAAELKEK